MFGIGAQEMVIVGLLALVILGPGKLPQMARDLGRLVQKARASMDEFKSELALEEAQEDLHRRREKDPESERRGLEAGRRRLGNHQQTRKGRLPEELGEACDGDWEAAEDERLEQDRTQEPAATEPVRRGPRKARFRTAEETVWPKP